MDEDLRIGEMRGIERRVFELERQMSSLLATTSVTAAEVRGLVQTMSSRFRAFDKGQDLILEKLETADGKADRRDEKADQRFKCLEDAKAKFTGAVLLAQILGISAIVGWIVALVRMIRD